MLTRKDFENRPSYVAARQVNDTAPRQHEAGPIAIEIWRVIDEHAGFEPLDRDVLARMFKCGEPPAAEAAHVISKARKTTVEEPKRSPLEEAIGPEKLSGRLPLAPCMPDGTPLPPPAYQVPTSAPPPVPLNLRRCSSKHNHNGHGMHEIEPGTDWCKHCGACDRWAPGKGFVIDFGDGLPTLNLPPGIVAGEEYTIQYQSMPRTLDLPRSKPAPPSGDLALEEPARIHSHDAQGIALALNHSKRQAREIRALRAELAKVQARQGAGGAQ
jgi:hypothetical protein